MKSTVFFFVLAVSGGALASAQTDFAPIAAPVRAQALSLPAEGTLVALYPADAKHPRMTYQVHRVFAADGTFTVAWTNEREQVNQSFRADGSLLSATETTQARSVKLTGDPLRTKVRTVISENGKTTDNTATLTPAIALRQDFQHLVIQAWLYGVRDGLKLHSLSPDGSLVGDFQIVFRPTAEPLKLTDKYAFPAEFRAALAGRSYVVADMSLTGMASLFFPHHFYLVYTRNGTGLEFAAYFGEDPKNPTFQYAVR